MRGRFVVRVGNSLLEFTESDDIPLVFDNLIEYNGTACTGFGDASHGIRLRPAGDVASVRDRPMSAAGRSL